MATLTLDRPLPRGEDLPCEDNQPLESEWHRLTLNLLIDILSWHWQARDDLYVGGNMFIYFDPEQATTRNFRGPDVFVVKGVKSKHLRRSWVLWEEDWLHPNYVIELASSSNTDDDFGVKKDVYEQGLKVPEYIIYNPETERLHGWRLGAGGRYGDELTPDARGWLWSEQLGLWLGLGEYRFAQPDTPTPVPRFFDAEGRLLPDKAEAEAERAEAEAQRATAAEQRAEALAAELARLKAQQAQRDEDG